MKLQAAVGGEWRDVFRFPLAQLPRVLIAADGLPDLPGEPICRLSIIDDAGVRYYRSTERVGERWRTVWMTFENRELTTPKRSMMRYR